jgi:hypothetical protein
MTAHIPRVIVTTPKADRLGLTPNILTRITLDGREWAVIGYKVEGNVEDMQRLTLTFLADVTITHSEPPPAPQYTEDDPDWSAMVSPISEDGGHSER